MSQGEKALYRALDELGITYERYEHPPAYTMEDCAGIDMGSAVHCKNLFLCNRQATEHFLLMVRSDKKFRTAEVSQQIEKSRLSFGSAEKLLEILGVEPGAVGPMGLINDTGGAVSLLMDVDLRGETLCVHPNVNTASIVLSYMDFEAFLRHTGHRPTFLHLEKSEDGVTKIENERGN